MQHKIIGTAGHVDHGKTSLIRALTQIDTDRLQEEKKRGITIELGFASMEGPDGQPVGIIDVPGHEKFIGNMLAGIGGIDLVLLVVAADEGVMPQTLEHLDILTLLNIQRGMTVLTKADLVDEEWMDLVEADLAETLQGTFLEGAPLVRVSARTGQGLQTLREHIQAALAQPFPRREEAPLRMPVDRVFTIDGFGTVVTGTLIEGKARVNDRVMLYPSGQAARIRNLQVHGQMVEEALAGQRTAVNLSGVKKEDLSRGMVLAAPDSLTPSALLDVRLQLLSRSKRQLKSGSRLHLHAGADEVLCKAVLLDTEVLFPGDSGFARLRLDRPLALRKGDPFVLRYYSPVETVGGGTVLDARPPRRRRFDPAALEALRIRQEGSREELLLLLIEEHSRAPLPATALAAEIDGSPEEVRALCRTFEERGDLYCLEEDLYIHRSFLARAGEKARALLQGHLAEQPLSSGMAAEAFRGKLAAALGMEAGRLVDRLVDLLGEEKILEEQGGRIGPFGHEVIYSPAQQARKEALLALYKEGGHQPPELGDILRKGAGEKEDLALLTRLEEEGALTRLQGNTFMETERLKEILADIAARLAEEGSISLGELRDALSTSRKYAMQILEYCDSQRLTRLVGDRRESF